MYIIQVIPWVFPWNRFLNVNYPVYLQMVSQCVCACVCVTKQYLFTCLHSYLSKCLHEKMHTSCLSTLYVTRFLLDLLSCTESGVPLHFSSCDCSQESLAQHYSKKKLARLLCPLSGLIEMQEIQPLLDSSALELLY